MTGEQCWPRLSLMIDDRPGAGPLFFLLTPFSDAGTRVKFQGRRMDAQVHLKS